jgi:hypothetical protein
MRADSEDMPVQMNGVDVVTGISHVDAIHAELLWVFGVKRALSADFFLDDIQVF